MVKNMQVKAKKRLGKYNYWRGHLGLPTKKKGFPRHFSSVTCSCNMEPCKTCIGY